MQEVIREYLEKAKVGRKQVYKNMAAYPLLLIAHRKRFLLAKLSDKISDAAKVTLRAAEKLSVESLGFREDLPCNVSREDVAELLARRLGFEEPQRFIETVFVDERRRI